MKALDLLWMLFWPVRAVAFVLFAAGVLALTLICLAFSTTER